MVGRNNGIDMPPERPETSPSALARQQVAEILSHSSGQRAGSGVSPYPVSQRGVRPRYGVGQPNFRYVVVQQGAELQAPSATPEEEPFNFGFDDDDEEENRRRRPGRALVAAVLAASILTGDYVGWDNVPGWDKVRRATDTTLSFIGEQAAQGWNRLPDDVKESGSEIVEFFKGFVPDSLEKTADTSQDKQSDKQQGSTTAPAPSDTPEADPAPQPTPPDAIPPAASPSGEPATEAAAPAETAPAGEPSAKNQTPRSEEEIAAARERWRQYAESNPAP